MMRLLRLCPWRVLAWLDAHRPKWCWAEVVMHKLYGGREHLSDLHMRPWMCFTKGIPTCYCGKARAADAAREKEEG